MFTVYILFSEKIGKYYIGHTSNLSDRMQRHNSGRSKYSKIGLPWRLVYQEEFDTKSEAYNREMEIKSWKSSKRIKELIHSAG